MCHARKRFSSSIPPEHNFFPWQLNSSTLSVPPNANRLNANVIDSPQESEVHLKLRLIFRNFSPHGNVSCDLKYRPQEEWHFMSVQQGS
jgi:hypothetical protein